MIRTVFCAVLVGCEDEILGDPAGSATFFVENRTASGFRVTMTLALSEGDLLVR